ncbi:MAG: zinc-ribbon domain-containing protein, partial [Acutalibacteraceae bacterium]
MICKNCGKEIVDDAKFCENCGTAVEVVPIQPEQAVETPREQSVTEPVQTPPVTENIQPNQAPETVQEIGKKKHVKFKDLPPKQKKKRAIIGVICLLIALILIISDCIGAAEKAEDKNEHIIETGNDDVFGGVSFDLTLEEFVETFNRCAENDTEYESVAELNKININNFVDIDSGSESLSAYLYNFGYSKGSNP